MSDSSNPDPEKSEKEATPEGLQQTTGGGENLAGYAKRKLGSGIRQAGSGNRSLHPGLIPGVSSDGGFKW